MLTSIGDYDIDLSQVVAVTDVQENPAEGKVPASFSFEIALHGNSLTYESDDPEETDADYRKVVQALSGAVSSGGVTFEAQDLVAVGPLLDDEEDQVVGFEVFFPGAEVALLYDTWAEAEAGRREVLAAANE